jgi:hypothetical protein
VVAMKDNEGPFQHSPNPMDPRLYLIGMLAHDLRGSSPRSDSANRLITLASDENPNISTAALVGSFRLHNASPKPSWTAAALASELFATHVPVYRDNMRDDSAQKRHRLKRGSALSRHWRMAPIPHWCRPLPPGFSLRCTGGADGPRLRTTRAGGTRILTSILLLRRP